MPEQPRPIVPPPTFRVEGVDYTSNGVETLRQDLSLLRVKLLQADEFDGASMLNHAIILLHHLREWMIETDIAANQTTTNDELPGMWEQADMTDGETDMPQQNRDA